MKCARSFFARGGFLALVGATGVVSLLLAGGCASPAPQGQGSGTTTDRSEIIRAGRWSG